MSTQTKHYFCTLIVIVLNVHMTLFTDQGMNFQLVQAPPGLVPQGMQGMQGALQMPYGAAPGQLLHAGQPAMLAPRNLATHQAAMLQQRPAMLGQPLTVQSSQMVAAAQAAAAAAGMPRQPTAALLQRPGHQLVRAAGLPPGLSQHPALGENPTDHGKIKCVFLRLSAWLVARSEST